MAGVVPHLLVGAVHGHPRGERLPATEVAGEPGMRPARDLNSQPMAAPEDMGGRPEWHLDQRDAVAAPSP